MVNDVLRGILWALAVAGWGLGCSVSFDDECASNAECDRGQRCDLKFGYCTAANPPGADVDSEVAHDARADGAGRLDATGGPDLGPTPRDGPREETRVGDAAHGGTDAGGDAASVRPGDAGPDTRANDAASQVSPDASFDATRDARPDPQPDARPDPQPDARPDRQPDARPDRQPDARPDPQLDARPDPQPDARPDGAPVPPLRPPASACERHAECASGHCVFDERTPNGFCLQVCEAADGCPEGNVCLNTGDVSVCFQQCQDECRDGWACHPTGDGGGVCLQDCRRVSCFDDRATCNEESGICEIGCNPACGEGRTCQQGRCVQQDGRCETDYHCPLHTHQCSHGRCVVMETTNCANPEICDRTQLCTGAAAPEDRICLYACQSDRDCPLHRACYPELGGACFYAMCGREAANGHVYRSCRVGTDENGDPRWPGTCLPGPVGYGVGPGDIGYCVEGGAAQVGEICDNHALDRSPNSRAVQCASGTHCFGDGDSPIDPRGDRGSVGRCAQVCDPRDGAAFCDAAANEACFSLSPPDDPNTVGYDETTHLGVCLVVDCDVRTAEGCRVHERCRPYFATDIRGHCTAAGRVGVGDPCTESADCIANAACIDNGEDHVCMEMCVPDAQFPSRLTCSQNRTCSVVVAPNGVFQICD